MICIGSTALKKRLILLGALGMSGVAFGIVDTNGNGASDIWERQFYGNNLAPAAWDPNADSDGDGWTNAQEAIAGTNPNLATGALGATQLAIQPTEESGLQLLSWPARPGKQYELFSSTDLRSWSLSSPPIFPSNSSHSLLVNASAEDGSMAPKVFWKLKIDDADRDHDGLLDAEEVALGSHPLKVDSDDDGSLDGIDPNPASNNLISFPDNFGLPESLKSGLEALWSFEKIDLLAGSQVYSNTINSSYPLTLGTRVISAGGLATFPNYGTTINESGMPSRSVAFDAPHQELKTSGQILKDRQQFTISMWLKLPNNHFQSNSSTSLFSHYLSNSTAYPQMTCFVNSIDKSNLLLQMDKVGNFDPNGSSFFFCKINTWNLDDGKWHLLNFVWKSDSRLSVYLDSALAASSTAQWSALNCSDTGYFLLGQSHRYFGINSFSGDMDRVSIHSRALAQPEITQLFELDSDRDGLSDYFEKQNFFPSLIDPLRASDPNQDSDNDGLSDRHELSISKTNLLYSDTDSDNLSDAWEIKYGYNPKNADSNGNGTTDGLENPDFDGLNNSEEATYGTSPYRADTDSDGTSDLNESLAFTNPLNSSQGASVNGIPPAPPQEHEFESIPMTFGGDYADWTVNITGMGPRDTFTRSFSSNSKTASTTINIKLLKNNAYKISQQWRGTKPAHQSEMWHCWGTQLDGLPAYPTFQSYHSTLLPNIENSFTLRDHWLVDNREGALTSHVHMNTKDGGGNVGHGKKAFLMVPVLTNTRAADPDIIIKAKKDAADSNIESVAWIDNHSSATDPAPRMPKLEFSMLGMPENAMLKAKLQVTYPREHADPQAQDTVKIPKDGKLLAVQGDTWKIHSNTDWIAAETEGFFGGEAVLDYELVDAGNNLSMKKGQVKFRIAGQNPDDAKCKAFIQNNSQSKHGDMWFAYAIAKHESNLYGGEVISYYPFIPATSNNAKYNQFRALGGSQDGARVLGKEGIPLQERAERFGRGGIGIFQVTGSIQDEKSYVHRKVLWNWQDNVRAGLEIIQSKSGISKRYFDRLQNKPSPYPQAYHENLPPELIFSGKSFSSSESIWITGYNGWGGEIDDRYKFSPKQAPGIRKYPENNTKRWYWNAPQHNGKFYMELVTEQMEP